MLPASSSPARNRLVVRNMVICIQLLKAVLVSSAQSGAVHCLQQILGILPGPVSGRNQPIVVAANVACVREAE
jgi:hypothetical protein